MRRMNWVDFFKPYIEDANKENASGSERGLILVWGSILDDLLLRILDVHTVQFSKKNEELFGQRGPFGSFGNRATACLALGLISKLEFSDLRFVKRLRNQFAHDLGATLSSPATEAQCHAFLARHRSDFTMPSARTAFGSGCFALSILLFARLSFAQETRRSEPIKLSGIVDEADWLAAAAIKAKS
jgi:DNA-binding MltR family transcriptional regulator